MRVLGGEHRDGIYAGEPPHGFAHGGFEWAAIHVFLDQVGDDFGIGLGDELVAFFFEFVLELDVIFDDAVMHDDHLARAIAMRMGVFLGRAPVRGPARVPDAIEAVDGRLANRFLEITKLAGGAAQFELAVRPDHGDSRGIVSAILEAAQAVQNQRYNFLRADVSDDAAHGSLLRVVLTCQITEKPQRLMSARGRLPPAGY